MSWIESEFLVARGYGKEGVYGQRRGDFGVYVRAYRDALTSEQRTVAHLIHLGTGFGVAAFLRQELAQRAGEIADAHIGSEFGRLSPQGRACEVRAIYDVWKRGGMFPSYLMDDANNTVWCEARDADGKTGLEFDLLTIRAGDHWLP